MTKKQQRLQAYKARESQANKQLLSETICAKFVEQDIYCQAETVMWYLHCRSEVRTLQAVSKGLDESKKTVIPYCKKDDNGNNKLGLWWLEDIAELHPGTWGILEPPQSRWGEKGKEVEINELDLIMVPGVAFDRKGGRLGNGAGYYDRLLQEVTPNTVLTGICFESQLCDQVIMESHDVYMDVLLTEKKNYLLNNNEHGRTKE